MTLINSARATSAAPLYFRSFCPKKSGRGYVDGALYHNNPVRVANSERKLLWPDVDNLPPDILLSLGTGHNREALEKERMIRDRKRESYPISPLEYPNDQSIGNRFADLFITPSLLKILVNRMDNILDTTLAWDRFYEDVKGSGAAHRYIRFNPGLRFPPPKLDDKKSLKQLEDEVNYSLTHPSAKESLRRIAHRLIASCFYFEKADVQPVEEEIIGLCTYFVIF